MAAYATEQDIIDRHGPDALLRAADRDKDQTKDTDTVSTALDDATAEIDTYIAVKYDLPLATIPDRLVSLCVCLAWYYIHDSQDVATEQIRQNYEDCLEWLKALAAGDVALGLDEPPASIGGEASLTAEDRIFTRTTMRNL